MEQVSVIDAPAEKLPFDDGSFDTVVSTLVLCTVSDPRRSLAEAKRVLVDGGALLFLEHVRGEGRARAWWQDRLERPWGWFAGGCHPNRPSGELIGEAGFQIEQLDHDRFPKGPPPVKPVIRGIARRP
jgi:SAM-dependent methyltransferase